MNDSHWSQELTGLHHEGPEPHLLREAMRTLQVVTNVFSREVGEPLSRLNLLRAVALGPAAGVGVLALARRLEINAAAVTRLLQELEREKLVARRKDPRDGRRSYFTLTAKGKRRLARIHERAHDFEHRLLEGVDAAQLAAAAQVLLQVRAVAQNLE